MQSFTHEITRFAPSPTGLLHLGHVYAAQVARDLALQTNGRFLLRIDDIDRARCRTEFVSMIEQDLTWLGLHWQGPVRYQSDCLEEYKAALERLRALDLIYPCFCTRREIQREAAHAQAAPQGDAGPVYPGTCRGLTPAQRQQRGGTAALRLDIAKALAVLKARPSFEEHGMGQSEEIIIRPEISGDVMLARQEGDAITYSYHLAVVVDDAAQQITLVTRGRDLLQATHIHRLLQVLLGLALPKYFHHPLVADDAGKRLAKRHDALSVRQLRDAGLRPEELATLLHTKRILL